MSSYMIKAVLSMGQYIHFTEDQKLRAASVDLEEFLRSRGEGLIRSGRDKRLKSDHSVTVNGNEWYDHATQKGGGPISFVQTFYGLSYPEAVTPSTGYWNSTLTTNRRSFAWTTMEPDRRQQEDYKPSYRKEGTPAVSSFLCARTGTRTSAPLLRSRPMRKEW